VEAIAFEVIDNSTSSISPQKDIFSLCNATKARGRIFENAKALPRDIGILGISFRPIFIPAYWFGSYPCQH
jgi:hypothetical protein